MNKKNNIFNKIVFFYFINLYYLLHTQNFSAKSTALINSYSLN